MFVGTCIQVNWTEFPEDLQDDIQEIFWNEPHKLNLLPPQYSLQYPGFEERAEIYNRIVTALRIMVPTLDEGGEPRINGQEVRVYITYDF